jgi:hypothetical protein
MGQAADFFVSYTSADRAWAEWIAWQLEDEGYQVVVQAWDFTPGHDWAHEMQHATATAKRVVVVLSPAYLGSAHGEAEWRGFYADDPSGERGLLLVVRVEQVKPSGLLKTRVYVDLVDQAAGDARRLLLAAARGARGKPTKEPQFPGDRRQAAPPFPGASPTAGDAASGPLARLKTTLPADDMEARRALSTDVSASIGRVVVTCVDDRVCSVSWTDGEPMATGVVRCNPVVRGLGVAPLWP